MITFQNSENEPEKRLSEYHFVPDEQILRIESETKFFEVYQLLHQHGQGAFFLVEEEEIRSFVRAYPLAEAVVGMAVKEINSIPSLSDEAKRIALEAEIKRVSNLTIGVVVREASRWTPVVPIDQPPIHINADEGKLQNREDRVFEVIGPWGERIGWYLNHESVRDATTQKTIYICTNPNDPHKNTDPDHGTCYQCPFPIGNVTLDQ